MPICVSNKRLTELVEGLDRELTDGVTTEPERDRDTLAALKELERARKKLAELRMEK